MVIAHRLWQRRFGADTNIVGQTIRLNNEPYTVVGVLPPKALVDEDCQFLVPFVFGTEDWQKSRGDQRFSGTVPGAVNLVKTCDSVLRRNPLCHLLHSRPNLCRAW